MSASWSTTIWGKNKRKFSKGLRVCSLWWRCQFLLISIAFGEDRCLRFFSEERAWRKKRKRGYTFARFFFTATPRLESLAIKKKIPRTGQPFGLAFPLNGTYDDFLNYYHFFLAALCSGTMHTWEGKLIQIVVACLWHTEMHFPPKKCCLILEIVKLKLEVAAMRMKSN